MDTTVEQKLIELWNANASGSQMRKATGLGRNVIAGKLHRLRAAGIIKPRAGLSQPKPRPKPQPGRPAPAIATAPADTRPLSTPPVDTPPRQVFVPEPVFSPTTFSTFSSSEDPNKISLMRLREHHCRWPFTQPDGRVLYCGEPKRETGKVTSYCAHHHAIAYRPRHAQALRPQGPAATFAKNLRVFG